MLAISTAISHRGHRASKSESKRRKWNCFPARGKRLLRFCCSVKGNLMLWAERLSQAVSMSSLPALSNLLVALSYHEVVVWAHPIKCARLCQAALNLTWARSHFLPTYQHCPTRLRPVIACDCLDKISAAQQR